MFKKIREMFLDADIKKLERTDIKWEYVLNYGDHFLAVVDMLYKEQVEKATNSGSEKDCLKMKHYRELYNETRKIILNLKANLNTQGKKSLNKF